MSESDTIFNERDRRCAAVQLMLSTDPSYDNRTIASTFQNANPDGSTLEGTAQRFGRPFGGGGAGAHGWGHHASSHLRSRLESQPQSVPGCAEECGDSLVQSGDRWLTLVVAAGLGAGPQVQRDPVLASEGVLRLCTLLSLPLSSADLNPLDYFVWSYFENITNVTSHNTKASLIAAIRRVFAEPPTVLAEKACSQFRIWRQLHWVDVSSTT